jgi:hypothetical protein
MLVQEEVISISSDSDFSDKEIVQKKKSLRIAELEKELKILTTVTNSQKSRVVKNTKNQVGLKENLREDTQKANPQIENVKNEEKWSSSDPEQVITIFVYILSSFYIFT